MVLFYFKRKNAKTNIFVYWPQTTVVSCKSHKLQRSKRKKENKSWNSIVSFLFFCCFFAKNVVINVCFYKHLHSADFWRITFLIDFRSINTLLQSDIQKLIWISYFYQKSHINFRGFGLTQIFSWFSISRNKLSESKNKFIR